MRFRYNHRTRIPAALAHSLDGIIVFDKPSNDSEAPSEELLRVLS
jgi:hypothetical protein